MGICKLQKVEVIAKEDSIKPISTLGAIAAVTLSKQLAKKLDNAIGNLPDFYEKSSYTSIVDKLNAKYLLLKSLNDIRYE